MIPLTVGWTMENKGTWDLVHINSIIKTKQFISHRNFKWLRGSVGRAYIHIGYTCIFSKSNEKIVVRNPKLIKDLFFIIYRLLSCLCVILQFIQISHLSKSLGFIPSLRGFRGARTTFSDSALMRDNVLFDIQSACWLSFYNLVMAQIVHHSWHLLRVLFK